MAIPKRKIFGTLLAGALACLFCEASPGRGDEALFTQTKDVVYSRKYGTALTLDVFRPRERTNGLGVIWIVSGGRVSGRDIVHPKFFAAPVETLARRGYTVFAVVHGSQPRFTIPEILEDMHRAVRFIRAHAADYQIDPQRIGIMGASAGGHLSLMQGTAGSQGNAQAPDPVDRESSRVQAVACFFPPTDFLNYGKTGEEAIGRGVLKGFHAAFAFQRLDPKIGFTGEFVPIVDEAEILKIGRQISPIYHITPDDAPTLIVHGDADALVPLQQSESFIAKLKETGVPCELSVKKGAVHGWPEVWDDFSLFADWLDRHLAKKQQ